MRKKLLVRALVLLVVAVIGAVSINPYFRQLVFGPRLQGTPLCAWQDHVRRQVLPGREDNFLASVAKLFQPKEESLPFGKLDNDEQTFLWLSLIEDRDPAMRVQAVNALWSNRRSGCLAMWSDRVWSGTSFTLAQPGGNRLIVSGMMYFDGPGWSVPKSPNVAPHLIRMLDDSDQKVRAAVFNALATQAKDAKPAFP